MMTRPKDRLCAAARCPRRPGTYLVVLDLAEAQLVSDYILAGAQGDGPTPEQRRTNLRLSLHYARLALADAEVRGDATSERIQVQDLERQMSALTQEHTA